MRIDEICVFINVLEAGSFAGAARRLGMPATTVSAKVAALERRLGLSLIQRTTRKLRATPKGQAYFERCRIALREIETVEAELRAESAGMDGQLRLTASVDIAQTLLPPVIAAFRKAYPAVAVDLVVTDRVADLVADDIDLAVRVGPLRDSSLISRAFVTGPSGHFQGLPRPPGHTCLTGATRTSRSNRPQQGMGATAADAGGRPEDRC
ncbi:hypothetical protein X768_14080 [Mesorhizobium sp. LSJC265A00]|uniref:LysR family transcriptional regulator n=1 Tax=Mesorhizobium sp. LSJC265A00 TaxID=1287322 RepID=UPI0003CF6326|nr:LysR family transcriptional regulator [Mesorhizobium sp. LSJC265A00]ESX10417.1 hypothetical protein X768_14080 [Mesorhizobium sp. LSJC265A00]